MDIWSIKRSLFILKKSIEYFCTCVDEKYNINYLACTIKYDRHIDYGSKVVLYKRNQLDSLVSK